METQGAQRPAPLPEIPGYRLEAVIGRGSTGTVYRAVQLAVQRRVALKILHPELAARGRAIRRLQREARTTAKLSHPGIVSAIDMGHIGSLWWYAMELVEGPSLAAKLRKDGPLNERDAVRLFIPLCEALEHAYEEGVVHRDLKPGNILIDSGGRARIVDLGLAFAEDDPALTAHGGTLGTPHYISPEQARDAKSADVRSDIWSVGATLYHCLCGRPPFAGESVGEILSGVLYSPVPDPTQFAPALSKGMQLVLRKCLVRDPEGRYQAPRELREDLEALRERRSVSVKRETLEPLLGERERKRKRALAAGALALAALIAAPIVWSVTREPSTVDSGRQPAADVRSFPALDAVAERARGGRKELGGAVAALEALQGAVPIEHSARADALNSELRQRLAFAIQAEHASFLRELNRLRIDQRDLVGARELVERQFPERLARELGLTEGQLEQQRTTLGLDVLSGELTREIEGRIEDVVERVRRAHAEQHAARAAEFEARGEWRNARAAHSVSARDVLASLDLPLRGLPPQAVEQALGAFQREVLDRARAELDARWTAADLDRDGELLSLERRLWAELKLRKVTDAAGKLRERWQELLARDLLAPDQFLPEVSDRARATLERAAGELAQTEAENDRQDAELALRDFLPQFERAFAAREFSKALASIERQLERRTMLPVRTHLEQLRLEAQILDSLVQRAAAEVERLGEERALTSLWLGIERSGRFEQARLPLDAGFRFVPSDGGASRLLALRPLEGKRFELISRMDLERLAGLHAQPTTPDARFEAALLRERTGDAAAAFELLPFNEPVRPEWQTLAAQLAARLELARSRHSREVEERRTKASELLFLVRRAAQNNETVTSQRQLEQIDTLLREYGEIDDVKADSAWLRQRRDELQRGPGAVGADAFRAAFGPNAIELTDNRRVAMRFVFDVDYQGQFQRNVWDAGAGGWSAPRNFSLEDLSSASLWPTLSLRSPLDVEQAMELDLVFDQPGDAGPPRLFAVSFAGVHVVLAGATDEGAPPRYAIVSGTDADFVETVKGLLARTRGVGAPFKGLSKGARHQLRIELRQGRGQVDLLLDGERLESRAVPRQDSNTAGANARALVVRSFERVRLVEATLRGSF
jgi:tRNA A-37 threonylcarbamoyl transferase component Bud32